MLLLFLCALMLGKGDHVLISNHILNDAIVCPLEVIHFMQLEKSIAAQATYLGQVLWKGERFRLDQCEGLIVVLTCYEEDGSLIGREITTYFLLNLVCLRWTLLLCIDVNRSS